MKIKTKPTTYTDSSDKNLMTTLPSSKAILINLQMLALKFIAPVIVGIFTSANATSVAIPQDAIIFDVANYGAIGDGITDDGPSIGHAIEDAIASNQKAAVIFKKDTTYQVSSQRAFQINSAENLILSGENTTIRVAPPYSFVSVYKSKFITISGFNFDYSIKPVVKTHIISKDMQTGEVVVQSPIDLNFSGNTWDVPTGTVFFGIPVLQGRSQCYIKKYEKLAGDHFYKITFDTGGGFPEIQGAEYLNTPVPNVAHTIGEVVYIWESSDLLMENCNIWSAPSFVTNIGFNTGDLTFKNFNIGPEPGYDCDMAAWRDGFHCIDNRGRLIFENCNLRGMQDDSFNISASLLYVTNVISPNQFVMTCTGFGGQYAPLSVGDEITAFNKVTGKGMTTHITQVVNQSGPNHQIIVSDPVLDLDVNTMLAVDSLAAPNSLVKNCTVEGTVQFRGKITVENTNFKLLTMWLENDFRSEGPIPKDILFNKCVFTRGIPGANTLITVKTNMQGDGVPEYKCKNIVFENCKLDRSTVKIDPGNEVIFKDHCDAGSWDDAGTWSVGAIAYGTDSFANFTGVDITADKTICLSVGSTIGNITFTDASTSSNNLFVTGNTLTLDVSAAAPVIDVTQNDRALTFYSVIAGNDGLQKNGGGTLVLTAANTYSGGTVVNSGTLVVSGGTITGPGLIDVGSYGNAANFTLAAGNVIAGGQFVIGAHGSTGTAAINGGALQVNGALYVGGYSEGTGTGTLAQTAGTVTVTAGIDFGGGGPNNGNYNLNGGTLTTSYLSKNGSGSARFYFNGGTLRPSVANANFLQGFTSASVQSGGAVIDTNAFNITIAQPLLDGGGGLRKNGTGTLTLSGANNYSGGTLVNAGALVVSGGTISGSGLIDVGSYGNAADFTLIAGNVTAGGQFVIGAHGSTGTAAINGGALQVNGALYVGGYSEGTGTGTLTQTAGTVTATGGINFGGGGPNNGNYNLNGGTLTTSLLSKNGSGSARFYFNGGTLRPSAANANFLQGFTSASVQSGGAIIDTNAYNITIAQPLLNGGGGLKKSGTGTLTLSGTNSYTGDTTVTAGTLAVTGSSIIDTNKLIINGGKVNLTGAERVGTLFFGSVQKPAGIYSATGAGGTIRSTNFTGSGTLIVTSATASSLASLAATSVSESNTDADTVLKPSFSSWLRSDGMTRISMGIDAQAGTTYRLMASPDLTPESWHEVYQTSPELTGRIELQHDSDDSKQFYRIEYDIPLNNQD